MARNWSVRKTSSPTTWRRSARSAPRCGRRRARWCCCRRSATTGQRNRRHRQALSDGAGVRRPAGAHLDPRCVVHAKLCRPGRLGARHRGVAQHARAAGPRHPDGGDPRRYSPNDVAAALATVLQREVTASTLAQDGWPGVFLSWSLSGDASVATSAMVAGFNRGHIRFSGDAELLRQGATTLERVWRTWPAAETVRCCAMTGCDHASHGSGALNAPRSRPSARGTIPARTRRIHGPVPTA